MVETLNNLRTRHLATGKNIFVGPSGHFFNAGAKFTSRYKNSATTSGDKEFLSLNGLFEGEMSDLRSLSLQYQTYARTANPANLAYLILVPTLRCNLSCSYCQVSRVKETSTGFDWSNETTEQVLALVKGLGGSEVKIEFQGGEPTLRLDIIQRVIEACDHIENAEFVICTNLAFLSDELWLLLQDPRVHISTSLDGNATVHQKQRTKDGVKTSQFFKNLQTVTGKIGSDRVSALPTIDQVNPPDPDELISAYLEFGFDHIFLRPINFQGFARKKHPASAEDHSSWWRYYDEFIRALIQHNYTHDELLEETYLSLCLKRIFRLGVDGHVDLRNPNPVGIDYFVIDYDGSIYPTDEARMLTRSGVINLQMGSVSSGIDHVVRDILNASASNNSDPQCNVCAYQPFCGRDLIDDLSRYGRIDMPRHETFFCQKHLHMFDLCMELIYSEDPATQYSLAKWLGLSAMRIPVQPVIA